MVTAKESLQLAPVKQESILRGWMSEGRNICSKTPSEVLVKTYRSSGLLTGLNDLNVLCGGGGNCIKRREPDHLSGPLVSDLLAATITHTADKMGGAEHQTAAKAADRDWEGQGGIGSFRQEEGFDQVGQPFVLAARSDGSGGG